MFKVTKETTDKIKRGWIQNFLTPGLAIVILVQVTKGTNYIADINARTLDSVEMKVRLQDHMEIWTPVAQHTAFARLKAVEDSAAQFKRADSITSVKLLQIEATLKRIEENQNRLLKELK